MKSRLRKIISGNKFIKQSEVDNTYNILLNATQVNTVPIANTNSYTNKDDLSYDQGGIHSFPVFEVAMNITPKKENLIKKMILQYEEIFNKLFYSNTSIGTPKYQPDFYKNLLNIKMLSKNQFIMYLDIEGIPFQGVFEKEFKTPQVVDVTNLQIIGYDTTSGNLTVKIKFDQEVLDENLSPYPTIVNIISEYIEGQVKQDEELSKILLTEWIDMISMLDDVYDGDIIADFNTSNKPKIEIMKKIPDNYIHDYIEEYFYSNAIDGAIEIID